MRSAYSSCLNAPIAPFECDLPLFQVTHSECDIHKVNISELNVHVKALIDCRDHVQAANLSNSKEFKHSVGGNT